MQTDMTEKKALYSVIVILVVMNVATLSYLLGINRFNNYMGVGMMGVHHSETNYNKPLAETHNNTHNFGSISRNDGVVSTTFEIENHGKEQLEIGDISTSCGCTSAEVDKTILGFNEKAQLTVYFDPNFHEEPQGELTRSVFVKTNDANLPEMQFDIYVKILD